MSRKVQCLNLSRPNSNFFLFHYNVSICNSNTITEKKDFIETHCDIVECLGGVSELLFENITILEMLESESNKEFQDDKFNRIIS
jgi:hypothetical protein